MSGSNLGAFKKRNKFYSVMYEKNKRYYLGTFETKKEAQMAYYKKYQEVHGIKPPWNL
jgi:hypothetical protein